MTLSTSLSFLMHQVDSKVADKPTREKLYNDMMEFSYRQPFIAVCCPFQTLPLFTFTKLA
jgi:hypothetical protein